MMTNDALADTPDGPDPHPARPDPGKPRELHHYLGMTSEEFDSFTRSLSAPGKPEPKLDNSMKKAAPAHRRLELPRVLREPVPVEEFSEEDRVEVGKFSDATRAVVNDVCEKLATFLDHFIIVGYRSVDDAAGKSLTVMTGSGPLTVRRALAQDLVEAVTRQMARESRPLDGGPTPEGGR